MKIRLDNEWLEVKDTDYYGDGIYFLELEDDTEWYVAESSSSAGEAAREYWKDLANNDPQEFRAMVGDEALIAWAMGQNYAVGSIGVNSLNEWLDLWLDDPEEHWSSYDGSEVELSDDPDDPDTDNEIQEELGFTPTVAYRHN